MNRRAYRCTEMKVFATEDTPPTVATTGTSPFGAESGTCTLIWNSPDATRPTKAGVTSTPPIRKVTGLVAGRAVVTICPSVAAGLVGPKPFPYSRIVSPGLAGVLRPG